jgi:hypothetical protein
VNPGGPGDSGVEFMLDLGPFTDVLLGAEVPARFDLVGFDPPRYWPEHADPALRHS